ncbi:MAG TPA: hypothetical protein VGG60_00170 [Candidatus Binataceae bacterium]|jgi:hypothetical protein
MSREHRDSCGQVEAYEDHCGISRDFMRPVEERPDPLERGAIANDHECEIEVWTNAAKRARISYFARLPVRVPFTPHLVCGREISSQRNDGVGIEITHPGHDRIECGVLSTGVQVDPSHTCADEVGEGHFEVRTIGGEEHAGREQAFLRDTAELIDDELAAIAIDLAIG